MLNMCLLGGIFGASWGLRGWSWEHFGALKVRLGAFGRSWDVLGATLGRFGVDLGASCVIVDVLGGLLGVSWGDGGGLGGLLGALRSSWKLVMHSQHAESIISINIAKLQ